MNPDPRCAAAAADPQTPTTSPTASGAALLQSVLQHSTPAAGQVVLGQLIRAPQGSQPGRAQVPLLGEIAVAASLVPLGASDVGTRIALSLLPTGDALVLGVLWEGAPSVAVDEEPEERMVQAQHRLTLRCGEAAIVLHADGRIELRGTYITSYASATQRIVGGSVHFN